MKTVRSKASPILLSRDLSQLRDPILCLVSDIRQYLLFRHGCMRENEPNFVYFKYSELIKQSLTLSCWVI